MPLTPKVFSLLRVLVENSGHLVEKDDLLKQVWPDSFVEEGALNRAVSVLRKALDDNASGQKYIETVPKRGYRFVGHVLSSDDEEVLSSSDGSPAAARPRVTRPLAIATVIALVLVGGVWFGLSRRADRESSRASSLPAPVHSQVTFTGQEGSPTVSPDGRRIAYVSDRNPEKKLIVQELAGGQPMEILRCARNQLPALVARRKRVALLGARRGPEWRLCRAAAWRQAASDRDGAGVPLVLVAGWLDDRDCRRPGQQDPDLRRARAGAAGVDAPGRSLVDLGSRLVSRRRQAALRQQRPPGPLRSRDHPG